MINKGYLKTGWLRYFDAQGKANILLKRFIAVWLKKDTSPQLSRHTIFK